MRKTVRTCLGSVDLPDPPESRFGRILPNPTCLG